MGKNTWTDERLARFKKMHADGITFPAMSARFGDVSTSALRSKASDMGLYRLGPNEKLRRPRKNKKPEAAAPPAVKHREPSKPKAYCT